MKDYLDILTLAADGLLPKTINANSHVSCMMVRELIDEGLLKGVVISKGKNTIILNPAITWQGRRFLTEQLKFIAENTSIRRALRRVQMTPGEMT